MDTESAARRQALYTGIGFGFSVVLSCSQWPRRHSNPQHAAASNLSGCYMWATVIKFQLKQVS